jgi:hypothetical protein
MGKTGNVMGWGFVIRTLSFRAVFFTFAMLAAGATSDPLSGKWVGHSPDPIGRTETVELRFAAAESGFTGVLHTDDRDIILAKVRLQGRSVTFDAPRPLRGRIILYHYDGLLSGDSIEFTVQNDDGSSFFRFVVHRDPATLAERSFPCVCVALRFFAFS